MVKLDPTSNPTEYNRVADEIRKTASTDITKIERVQNPGLYRAYMVKKDQMEQKNGANEKFLFHGTAQGSCSSINKFGFNRSYCGKNGKRRRLIIIITIIIVIITIIIFIVMVIIIIIIYYIDTSVFLENIPLLKFIKTTSGTRVFIFHNLTREFIDDVISVILFGIILS